MTSNGIAPIDALIWAALGLIVAVPILLLIKSAIDGAIDAGVAVSCCAAILMLLALVMRTAGTGWMIVSVLLLLGACGGLPYYFTQLDKRAHEQMRNEDMEKYRSALERDPHNAGAHAMLAEEYLKVNQPAAAVQHLQAAITLATRNQSESQGHHVFDQNPNLDKWRRRLRTAETAQAEQEAAAAAKGGARS